MADMMNAPIWYPAANEDPSLVRPMDMRPTYDPKVADANGNSLAKREAAKRKEYPMFMGLLKYFPDALAEIAHLSKVGNDQHNPGQPLHWAREKSTDQLDALLRHLKDHAKSKLDTDGERHLTKVAWRALAELQLELERERDYVNPLWGHQAPFAKGD